MLERPDSGSVRRFFETVDRSGGPDACHTWKLRLDSRGYGQFSLYDGTKPAKQRIKRVLAHRLAWVLEHGPIPKGRNPCVLHRCDNPKCVNVRHLFLGTDLDNNRDMWRKGRAVIVRGAEHGRARVADHVNEIRLRILSGEPMTDIAKAFGVIPASIFAIKKNKNYRHIPWPEGTRPPPTRVYKNTRRIPT